MVFPRDRDKGDRIVAALSDRYSPSLVIYERGALARALGLFDSLVALMAVGIVVRSLCSHLKDKWTDRPVVAVDSALRCAVPVVGGHHGGNDLALHLAEALGLYPAITTATSAQGRPSLEGLAERLGAEIVNREASKAVNLALLREDVPVLRLKGPRIVVVDEDVAVLKVGGLVLGLGARRGVQAAEVLKAIDLALEEAGRRREEIGVIATAELKSDERGIIEAARTLGVELLCLPEEILNSQVPTTPSRAECLGLVGVAEPAVLALASRLVLSKRAYGRVTVAIGE
ncbi:MAG: cobalt-precorrin 5A hydrolase [Methanothrix sp.]|nr:cobalt-precorrin 5A hydrolase [Methanothrix sp.]